MPGGQPGIIQPGYPVDDRVAVRVPGPEAAPLVGGAQPGHLRQPRVQVSQDRVDDVLPNARAFVAGVHGAASQQSD
jgi:hypothetical protein